MANYFLQDDGEITREPKKRGINYTLQDNGYIHRSTLPTMYNQYNGMSLQELESKRQKLNKEIGNTYKQLEKRKNIWWDKDKNVFQNLGNVFKQSFIKYDAYDYSTPHNKKVMAKANKLEKQEKELLNIIDQRMLEDKNYKGISGDVEKYGDVILGNLMTGARGIDTSLKKITGNKKYIQDKLFAEKAAERARSKATNKVEGGILDVVGSISRMAPQIAAGAFSPNVATITGFANYGGGAYNEAKEQGYGEEAATKYGLAIGTMEMAMTKALGTFGSIYGKSKLGNYSQKIIDKVIPKIIKNPAVRNVLAQMGGEGLEEFIQEYTENIAKDTLLDKKGFLKATLDNVKSKENLENALYSGLLGAITSGVVEVPSAIANKSLNIPKVEQKVVTVEDIVEPSKNKTITIEEAIEQENLPTNRFTYEKVENENINDLNESMSKYFDNSQKTKDLSDTIAKIISDKNYKVVFDNKIVNKQGNTVNAQIKVKDGEVEIKLNPDSSRAAEFLMVHEITHAIETNQMKELVMDYASKNEGFNEALEELKQTYGVDDVTDEVLADISGQLFGNQEFIMNLSMEKPNLFRRIYNKIIEIANKITGNSNEALFIRDLKNKWEEAYRNVQQNASDEIKYSTDLRKEYNNDGGYLGKSMSKRAAEAYKSGEAPLSKWTKDKIINEVYSYAIDNDIDLKNVDLNKLTLKELRDNLLTSSSWHHTGNFYNKTDFYEISDYGIERLIEEGIDSIIKKRLPRRTKTVEEKALETRKKEVLNNSKDIYDKLETIYVSQMTKLKTLRAVYNRWESGKFNLDEEYKKAIDFIKEKDKNVIQQWEKYPNRKDLQEKIKDYHSNIEKFINDRYKSGIKSRKILESIKRKLDKLTQNAEKNIRILPQENADKIIMDKIIENGKPTKETTNLLERLSKFKEKHTSDFDSEHNKKTNSDYYYIDDNFVKLTTTEENGKLYIDELYVEKPNKGVGTKIVNLLKQYAKENNLKVDVSDELSTAKGFWDKVLERKVAKYSQQEKLPIEKRVSGDELLDAQDLIEEVQDVGAKVDENGYVTVYHQTSSENAKKIKLSGKMVANEKWVYFSTSKDAEQSIGRGQEKLVFKIPAEKLLLDDIFSDNADVKVLLNKNGELDVSEYLVDENQITSNELKEKQFKIIKKTNPAPESENYVWIRNPEDIKTWEEVLKLNDDKEGQFGWGDYTREDAERDLQRNKITVYSSYPIKNGTFVSTSYQQALDYAGGDRNKVHSKTIQPKRVAWINGDEGQYASIQKEEIPLNRKIIDLSNVYNLSGDKLSPGTGAVDIKNPYIIDLRTYQNNKQYLKNNFGEVLTKINRGEHDGAIIKSKGEKDLYVITNENQITSNKQYSQQPTTDNKGRKLSKEQQEFFKDSKVRDEEGNLEVLYHGTNSDFNIFKRGEYGYLGGMIYLTNNYNKAKHYTDYGKIKELYANSKNPFVIKENNVVKEILNKIYGSDNVYKNRSAKQSYETRLITKSDLKKLQNMGYDSIVWEFGGEKEVALFNSNQIKNVDNTTPTTNEDIRYSKESSKWQEHLEKNYKATGTRTYTKDILLPKKEVKKVETKVVELPIKPKKDISKLTKEDANTTPILPTKESIKGNSKSGFAKNIENIDLFSEETKNKLLSDEEIKFYNKITNKESLDKAFNRLNENGQEEVLRWIGKDSKKANSTDVAEGWILLKQYQDKIAKTKDAKTREQLNNSMVEIARKMRDIGTTSAQTIQAFSIMQRMTPEGMVYYAQNELQEAFDKMSKNKTAKWIKENSKDFELTPEETQFIIDTMKEIQTMKDGYDKKVKLAEIQKVMTNKLPPEKGSGIKGWMRISMLFNPKTQVRNFLGNAIIKPTNILGDIISSEADKQIAKKTGVRTRGISLEGFGKAFKTGIKQSIEEGKKGINTRNVEGNKFEFGDRKAFKDNTKIGKALNRLDNVLNTVMDAGDRGFYNAEFETSLNNQMKLNNVTEPTEEMIKIATDDALARTWQDNNAYTNFVLKVRKMLNGNKAYGAGDILIPFAKTPANLTKAIIDYSPIGMIGAIKKGLDLKNSLNNGQFTPELQHKFVDRLGKATAGTLLYILGAALAKAGITSGKNDDDKDVSAFMRNTLGISPYSVKIGNKSFSYSWAQPIAAPIAITANIVNKKKEDANLLEKALSSLNIAGDMLLEQSFMESLNTVLNNRDGIFSGLKEALLDLPSRAIPTLFKQIADMVDTTQRTTFEYDKPLKTATNKVKSKIPFATKNLPKMVDTLGRDIKKYGGNAGIFNVFLNPANVNKGKLSESGKEIYRLYKETGDKTIMPRVAPYYINQKGEKINLTAKEKAQFQKVAGEIIEKQVSNLLDNDAYNEMNEEEKANIVKEIVDYAYNYGREVVTDIPMSNIYQKAKRYVGDGGDLSDYYTHKQEIDYSYTNPSKYKTIRQISPYNDYLEYNTKINDIRDKSNDKNRKYNVITYVNRLNLSIPQKAMLIKLYYKSFKNYDNDIIEYVNKQKLGIENKSDILKQLGFKVRGGKVYE